MAPLNGRLTDRAKLHRVGNTSRLGRIRTRALSPTLPSPSELGKPGLAPCPACPTTWRWTRCSGFRRPGCAAGAWCPPLRASARERSRPRAARSTRFSPRAWTSVDPQRVVLGGGDGIGLAEGVILEGTEGFGCAGDTSMLTPGRLSLSTWGTVVSLTATPATSPPTARSPPPAVPRRCRARPTGSDCAGQHPAECPKHRAHSRHR